jgi:hypothetical protein
MTALHGLFPRDCHPELRPVKFAEPENVRDRLRCRIALAKNALAMPRVDRTFSVLHKGHQFCY